MKDEYILKLLKSSSIQDVHIGLQNLYSKGITNLVNFIEKYGDTSLYDIGGVALSNKSILLNWASTREGEWVSFSNKEIIIYVGHRIVVYPVPQTLGSINYEL